MSMPPSDITLDVKEYFSATLSFKHKVKILILEENIAALDFLTNCLKTTDKILLTASHAEEALQQATQNTDIALVLVSVPLHSMDNDLFVMRLRNLKDCWRIPIIFLTALTDLDTEQIHNGYSLGVVDYLIKPININVLISKIDVFVRLQQQTFSLRHINQLLLEKIFECKQVENTLQNYKNHLETEVARRTAEWREINQQLEQSLEEHLQTEKALRIAEARYRSIFENSIEGIFQTTPEGHYLQVNSALVKLYGYHSAAELMENLNDIRTQLYLDPRRRDEFKALLEKQDIVRDFESQVYRADGSVIWITENARAVRNDVGELLYYEGTVVDITIRKKSEQELARTNQAYQRFVPHDFLRLLGKRSITEVNLNDYVQRDLTILFSDIRSFTQLSEQMTPRENFEFINSYFSLMGPIVRDYYGFIDKYIGDSIMALFDESPDNAVNAAITMLQKLVAYNEYLAELGKNPIKIGIGINTGLVMLGTIGEYNRMEGTVISDAVNVASRIEAMTKIYSTPLLISANTYAGLKNPEQYAIRFIDRVAVRGKTEEVTIYEVFETDSEELRAAKLAMRADFEAACQAYHAGNLIEAARIFENKIFHPEDKVAQVYKKRCLMAWR